MAKLDNKFGAATVTPKGNLHFFDLDTPNTKEKHPNNQYPTDKFEVTLSFSKDTDLSALKTECEKVATEAFGGVDGVELPFANGDEKSMDSFKGKIVIRAKGSKRPGVVNGQKERVLEDEVSAGMFARLQVTPMSYKSGKTKGVTFLLKNVQVFTDMPYESLGGGQSAESAFGDDDDGGFGEGF